MTDHVAELRQIADVYESDIGTARADDLREAAAELSRLRAMRDEIVAYLDNIEPATLAPERIAALSPTGAARAETLHYVCVGLRAILNSTPEST